MVDHDITTRHGFLAALHDLLQPQTYLEIGVQHGTSLALAHSAQRAIGIDPEPLVEANGNQVIFRATSDEFFAYHLGVPSLRATIEDEPLRVDLAFIDGMHLSEYALRDYLNIEQLVTPKSVVVFDDVLPRNQEEARRIPPGQPIVGDWTGDVWKLRAILGRHRMWLRLWMVDVAPTGLMILADFRPEMQRVHPDDNPMFFELDMMLDIVPQSVIDRQGTLPPDLALAGITQWHQVWRHQTESGQT